MSDLKTTSQTSSSTHSESRPEGVQINLAGHQLRIDGPHPDASSRSVPETVPEPVQEVVEKAPPQTIQSQSTPPAAASTISEPSSFFEDSLLMDAGRIFDQMRNRLVELETREKALRDQQAHLSAENDRIAKSHQKLENELHDRRVQIEQRERQLQHDLVEAENERNKLEQRASQLHQDETEARERLLRLQKELEKSETELETLRHKQATEMAQRESDMQEELTRRQLEFDQKCQEQLAELKQQQLLTTKRMTFQEQHLEKSRHEFESQRTVQQQEFQQGRSQIEELTQQQLMRRSQLKRLRELIDLRAHSLHREEELIRESLLRQKGLLHQEASQFAAASKERTRREQIKREELQRRYDELVMRERQVISRTERLEALRYELDLTHRENLELRISLEEIWADLCDQLGGEEANRRVEEHRALLSAQYENREAAIVEDFLRLEQYRREIQAMQQDLDRQRQNLAGESAVKHQELDLRQARLDEQQTQLRVLFTEVDDQKQDWERRQIDAEKMIQQLVEELELMNDVA